MLIKAQIDPSQNMRMCQAVRKTVRKTVTEINLELKPQLDYPTSLQFSRMSPQPLLLLVSLPPSLVLSVS